jgi:hypothetical protein
LGQYYSLKVTGCSKVDLTEGLPKDVLGQCATGQKNLRAVRLGDFSRDLEDPDIVWATAESDI